MLFDALPDGRLLTLDGGQVAVETALQSGTFSPLGTVSGFAPGFGPSFFTISPDGTRAAAGSNGGGSVVVFNTSDPTAVTSYAFAGFDYDAVWIDNSRLAIAGAGTFTDVRVLDTIANTTTTVITGIGGASAGITLDAAGNLYTGNGFDTSPGGSNTGWVKAFAPSQWQAALSGGSPVNFETSGTPVVDLLSAASLGFDDFGNFFVGGADFFGGSGDFGYAALVDTDDIAAALTSPSATPPIDRFDGPDVLRQFLSPQSTIDDLRPPFWVFNQATDELYLRYFQEGEVRVYVVPEPSVLALLTGSMLVALRRRRRAIATASVAGAVAVGGLSAPALAQTGPYSNATGVTPNAPDNPVARSSLSVFENRVVSYNPAPGVRLAAFGQPLTGFASLGDLYSPLLDPDGNNVPFDRRFRPQTGTEPNVFHMGNGAANFFPFNGNVNDSADTYGFIGIDAPGSITLGFAQGIRNGSGADFAVFENGFLSGPAPGFFAELAFVEVSTDGTNFARFPSISLNTGTVSTIGTFQLYDMTNVYNLAGKHASNLGTPFNLDELATSPLALSGQLDLNNIQFVRLVDVVGSGTVTNGTDTITGALDSLGNPILDNWVTFDSGGFDYLGLPTGSVGVINVVPEPGVLSLLGASALLWLRRRRAA